MTQISHTQFAICAFEFYADIKTFLRDRSMELVGRPYYHVYPESSAPWKYARAGRPRKGQRGSRSTSAIAARPDDANTDEALGDIDSAEAQFDSKLGNSTGDARKSCNA